MFYVNKRFGSHTIFASYLDRAKLVIPGEIQHSYWTKPNSFQSKLRRLGLPLYVWGGTPYQTLGLSGRCDVIPIGDPFLYAQRTIGDRFGGVSKSAMWLLMPQFLASENVMARRNHHFDFIKTCQRLDVRSGNVKLHPTESLDPLVTQAYMGAGYSLSNQINGDFKRFLYEQIQLFAGHSGVISNYLGPHIFRAPMVGTPSFLIPRANRVVHSEYRIDLGVFDFESNLQSRLEAQREISEFELGLPFFRSRHELHEIFHTSTFSQSAFRVARFGIRVASALKQLSTPQRELVPKLGLMCPHCYEIFTELQLLNSYFCRKCLLRVDPGKG